jgi:flagellar motor switch/type III secretory pathway protein FliN
MSETQVQRATPTATNDLVRVLAWVPLTVSLETRLEQFTVRDLLSLKVGSIVKTAIPQADYVPLLANGKLIAWARLEVAGERLAARITELT